MILFGSQRGGAKNLALHLMKDENDHIDVHEVRGFAADTVMGALNEAYALSRGTKCKKFLYSLSLNAPPDQSASVDDYEAAIEQAEERLGLKDQPRVIVFHEKQGPNGPRRHAHAVWSRIDTDQMKAVHIGFDHRKLETLSRDLFLHHGWKMPRGHANSKEADPRNFTLAEWQQAKRAGNDPREIKTAIQDAWAISDTKAAFEHALNERGFMLARGDRRGHVAVHHSGEVYSIARQAKIKTKLVRERLGDEQALPSIDEAKDKIANALLPKLKRLRKDVAQEAKSVKQDFALEKTTLVEKQRAERAAFKKMLDDRRIFEAQQRQARFRGGIGGLWDRLSGQHRKITAQNQQEAEAAQKRDRLAHENLIQSQLEQRRALSLRHSRERLAYLQKRRELKADAARYWDMQKPPDKSKNDEVAAKAQYRQNRQRQRKPRKPRGRDPEPDL
ncbi:MAG: relaxase [Pseudomonadota bacterium]